MDNKKINGDDINIIKNKIAKLYNDKTKIHVTINVKRKNAKDKESEITGIYKNFFSVKAKGELYTEEFSISYIDLLIGNIAVKELN